MQDFKDFIDGEVRLYWKPTLGLSMILFMMLTTFTVMVLFGVKTAKALQNKGLSQKTIKLQKQLLIALAFQALIPLVLTYIPRTITLLLPIMGISLPSILRFTPLVITLSITVLDPFAIILCISDYRCLVLQFIKNPIRSTVIVPTVTIVLSTTKTVQK
ncbi:unnamed protein product [Cylicocyclus nassatus]|uniref:G protein-coupled receptor n=1 Tax=Cylicocyclus nassatus TaxID=53992 RepID=A0AA36DJN3_CYLNA|nr:unnamed protein product [Cylicocyclus nassatus]